MQFWCWHLRENCAGSRASLTMSATGVLVMSGLSAIRLTIFEEIVYHEVAASWH